MISSVVARIESSSHLPRVCSLLAIKPNVEVGQAIDGVAIPLTMEAETPEAMEELHRWLRELPGVQLIDVVCVYY